VAPTFRISVPERYGGARPTATTFLAELWQPGLFRAPAGRVPARRPLRVGHARSDPGWSVTVPSRCRCSSCSVAPRGQGASGHGPARASRPPRSPPSMPSNVVVVLPSRLLPPVGDHTGSRLAGSAPSRRRLRLAASRGNRIHTTSVWAVASVISPGVRWTLLMAQWCRVLVKPKPCA
jgi:hypothetical protein